MLTRYLKNLFPIGLILFTPLNASASEEDVDAKGNPRIHYISFGQTPVTYVLSDSEREQAYSGMRYAKDVDGESQEYKYGIEALEKDYPLSNPTLYNKTK